MTDKQEPHKTAYALGWIAAASWAKRDDLLADMGSPAYIEDMESALQALAAPPAQPAPAPRKLDIPPAPADPLEVVYAEGWNAACDAFFGGLPPQEPLIITVTQPAPAQEPHPLTTSSVVDQKAVNVDDKPAQRLSDARLKDIANGLNGHHPMLGQWQRDKLMRNAIEAAIVQPGYCVVPIEPTPEMLAAADKHCYEWRTFTDFYKGMLAAAQSAPKSQS